MSDARDDLLHRVITYAASDGIADKSLREIATGSATSHRMLHYHFGSRAGLLAAIVATIEQQQRDLMAALLTGPDAVTTPQELMLRLWRHLSDPVLRPYVRLFFSVTGLAVQGTPGTEALLGGLTEPWLAEGAEAAGRLGIAVDPAGLRVGVAVARGLLLDLLAGADPAAVDDAYLRFVEIWSAAAQ